MNKISDDLIIYPSPPDTARIQFLTCFSNLNQVVGKRSSFSSFLFGDPENIIINKPYGIAVSKSKIFICDTYIKGLVLLNLEKKSFEQFIPKGKGELKVPINCFVDAKGYLYVADAERKQIVIFNDHQEYVGSFGNPSVFKPIDVNVADNKIWVTNLFTHQVNVFSTDSTYRLLSAFPDTVDVSTGVLYSPTNICVSDQKVYVTDFGDFKIKIFDKNGRFLDTIGTLGLNIGQLNRPKGIAVDKDANLFVVDASFENVQIYNKTGNILMYFGGHYKGPGDMWLPAKIAVDYSNISYFQKYVDPAFKLKYLIFVTNQFGPDKINVYGAIEPNSANSTQENSKKKKKKKTSSLFNN